MTLQVSYMGTKRSIAPFVAEVVSNAPKGPLLDLFSGICAVGSAVGTNRPVWSNDVQLFASNAATALFTSRDVPLSAGDAADVIFPAYTKNKAELCNRHRGNLRSEELSLRSRGINQLAEFYSSLPYIGSSNVFEQERKRLARSAGTFPYRLFTITFAGGYFGLAQCIQIDSIRYSIDIALKSCRISKEQHRWLLLALCQAICKVATTTGHFAQFMSVNQNNVRRYITQRGKSVWLEWLGSIEGQVPCGNASWRKENKVFNDNATDLLTKMRRHMSTPSVVYADPPYTKDQYSRYYHVYETLIRYDYPTAAGNGRYRPDRYISGFSLKGEVSASFVKLIEGTHTLGSQLIISYPEKGLLRDTRNTLSALLRNKYRNVDITHAIDLQHSSMGASRGYDKHPATELIFWAR